MLQKKIFVFAIFFSLMSCTLAMPPINQLIIVNHFNHALNFNLGINPEVLPNLPVKFSINANNYVQSKVLDIKKESYIRVDGLIDQSAFWGVEISNHVIKFHGYISKGIAYSWDSNKIIFCTLQEYKTEGHC